MRFALPPSDTAFAKPEIHYFSLCPGMARTIEPVGRGYALLQGKFLRDSQRE